MMAPQGPVLRDIHLPPAPAWWPPAPGWWGLASLLIALIVVGVLVLRRYRSRRRLWQRVCDELDQLAGAAPAQVAAGVSQLMRRVARLHDAAAVTAQGEAWQALVQRYAVDTRERAALVGLEQEMYRPHTDLDVTATLEAARQWLRRALAGRARR